MRVSVALLLALLVACDTQDSGPPPLPIPPAEELAGLFEGRVPAAQPEHEKIKVAVTLSHDPATRAPTLASVQWIPVPPDTVVRHVWQGTWHIETGTPLEPDARVYVLDGAPEDFRMYQAIGEHLLLTLDSDRNPKIGNASWNFTLSRTQ